MLAALLQGALMAAPPDAAQLGPRLERLNRFLLERTAGEKYATVFCALVEADGRVRYVNAAHCPPLCIQGAVISELPATSVPVGLLEGAEFGCAEVTLQPGARLLVYSDGVSEACNAAGEFFGKRRLMRAVEACPGAGAAELHAAVEQAVAEFTGGAPQADDMTLLVLEYSPQAR